MNPSIANVAALALAISIAPGCTSHERLKHMGFASAVVRRVPQPAAAVSPTAVPPAVAARPAMREIVMPMLWIVGRRPNEDAKAYLARDFSAVKGPTLAEAIASAPPHQEIVKLEPLGDPKLTAESVARELAIAHDEARACYASALRGQPGPAKRADVDLLIDRSGTVSTVRVRAHDIDDPHVIPCIANSYFGLHFAPPSSKLVEVREVVTMHG